MNMSNSSINMDHKFKALTYGIRIVMFLIWLYMPTISKDACFFCTIAMIPSVVVIFFDKDVNKYLSSTICTFNLVGMMPYIKQIILAPSIATVTSLSLLNDITVWIIIYGAVLLGWIIYLLFPFIISRMYLIYIKLDIKILKKQKQKINSEWFSEEDGNDPNF